MSTRRAAAANTAAIFDLDRTLIAGPSATAFADSLHAAGHHPAPRPRRRGGGRHLPGDRRDVAHLRRRPPRGASHAGVVGRPRPPGGRGRRRRADEHRPAVRARRHRRAPRGRAHAGDGHHEPGRTGHPVRRTPRDGRGGGDAVDRARRRVHRRARRADRLGPGQARGGARMGRPARHRPEGLVGLQRQLLRRPAARRPSATRWRSTPTCAWPGLAALRGWPVRHLDLPEGVPKIAGRELQDWSRFLARPELLANVRLDIAGHREDPEVGSGDRRVQPPQLLRQRRRRHGARPDRSVVPLPRQEGGVRRTDHRRLRADGRRHPGEPVVGIGRAAGSGDQGARGRRGDLPRPRGHDPAWAGLLRPGAQGPLGRGPAGRGQRAQP